MGAMVSQITSLTIVYSTVYSSGDQRKHQSSASLSLVRGIHRRPVNSPHQGQRRGECFHLMTSSCSVAAKLLAVTTQWPVVAIRPYRNLTTIPRWVWPPRPSWLYQINPGQIPSTSSCLQTVRPVALHSLLPIRPTRTRSCVIAPDRYLLRSSAPWKSLDIYLFECWNLSRNEAHRCAPTHRTHYVIRTSL